VHLREEHLAAAMLFAMALAAFAFRWVVDFAGPEESEEPQSPGERFAAVEAESIDGGIRIRGDGQFDFWTAPKLRTALLQAAGKRESVIEVELADVRYFGSAAIAALIECNEAVETYGGRFTVLANDYVREVLAILNLDKQFLG